MVTSILNIVRKKQKTLFSKTRNGKVLLCSLWKKTYHYDSRRSVIALFFTLIKTYFFLKMIRLHTQGLLTLFEFVVVICKFFHPFSKPIGLPTVL